MTGFAEPRVILAADIAPEPAPVSHKALSARELAVFALLGNGRRCKEIADDMGLSMKTVSTYRARAYRKMGMTRHHELVMYCVKNGLIDGTPKS